MTIPAFFKAISLTLGETSVEINIQARDFIEGSNNDFLSPREGWFVNMSSVDISLLVIGLLQLGEDFCLLPPTVKQPLVIDAIKKLESNLRSFHPSKKMEFRNFFVYLFWSLFSRHEKRTTSDKRLLSTFMITKEFFNNNKDILITKADKGNSVVALDRNSYGEKRRSLLSDTDTYTMLRRSPINRILSGLHKLLTR